MVVTRRKAADNVGSGGDRTSTESKSKESSAVSWWAWMMVHIQMPFAVGIMYATYRFILNMNIDLPMKDVLADRLMFTIRWLSLEALVFSVAILIVAQIRLYTPAHDPLDPRGKVYVEVFKNILQNTLEQMIASIIVQLVLCTYVTKQQLVIIPTLCVLFVIGRVLFAVPYALPKMSNIFRGMGFMLTMFPNLFLSIYCVYLLAVNGSLYKP